MTENILAEMKGSPQWVLYVKEKTPEGEHPRKQMISVRENHWHKAKSTDPNDWAGFDEAYSCLRKSRYDGMAYVLTEGLVFIDIDDSIDQEGNLSKLAEYFLAEFPLTYAERSCSGRGIHIFLKGSLPKDSMKRNDDIGLECYEKKRFCCMTGDLISKTSDLYDYSERFQVIASKMLKRKEPEHPHIIVTPLSMSNKEVLDRAFHSRSGSRIARLYAGDISDYPSHSNADMAFLSHMAFWTRNLAQLDSLMRSSGLYRPKWDEKRGDLTYGEITIASALRLCGKVYEGKKQNIERY